MLTPEGAPASTDFSLAAGVRHINHGSFGAVPSAALRAQRELSGIMNANPCDWFMDMPGKVAPARRRIAAYLGAPQDATALVPNASAGASVVYNNVPAWRGMEIVTTDHSYGAILMGAQRLAARWEGSVNSVHIPLDASDDEVFDRVTGTLNENTALVVIDHVTSATARVLPAGRIAAEGRRRGIPVLVDAAHSPGLFAEPLAGIGADFWVGNLHKFACAPRGTAALVASGPHTQVLYPLIDSWGAPEPFPARFDQQGTIDITSYLAAPVAMATLEQRYGWDEMRRYITELADYAQSIVVGALTAATGEDAAVSVGVPVNGLRLVRLPAGLVETQEEAHWLRHIIAAQLGIESAITHWGGHGYLRLSTHVYNTADDFEDFVERAVPFIVELGRTERRK
ncbi:aminotransferase class V-fold PLP-dependent enzyme [Arthrobacter oryzae]|nr:aminotransferase class V-fold PLP-dependent enzyme [Arthrobacter oryzae]